MRISKNICLTILHELNEMAPDGTAPLYFRISGQGRREISPGIKVKPEHWDKQALRVKSKCPDAFRHNRTLGMVRARIEDIDLKLSLRHATVTAAMVKAAYLEQEQTTTATGPQAPLPGDFPPFRTVPEVPTLISPSRQDALTVLPEPVPASPTKIVINEQVQVLILSPGSTIPGSEGQTGLPPCAPVRRTLMQALNWKYSKFAGLVKVKLRSPNTLRRWMVTKGKLRAFLKKAVGRPDIFLDEIKFSLAEDFKHFLLTDHKIKPNTAGKYIKNTKELLKIAEDREWITKSKWANYTVVYDQPDRKFLSMAEIIRLFQKPLIQRLDHVRNIFLFSCFTGYAFQEVLNLKRTDLFIGIDGKRWIKITRQKSHTEECIPLLPIAAAIVDHYWNNPYCIEHQKLLPVKSYKNYNGYLKEVGTICEIPFELSTHIARHTFATTICLDNGVLLEVVSRMLGHRSIRTTQIYAKVTHQNVSRTMTQLEKALFTPEGMIRMEIVPSTSLAPLLPTYSPAIAV